MGAFARGKNAYGISDRSGFRYKLNSMKREWNGSLVGPDEFDPKQPQLFPSPNADDPQALRNARPDRVEPTVVVVGVPLVTERTFIPVRGIGQVGTVTVGTTQTAVTVTPDGVSATSGLGSVSITTNTEVDVAVTGVAGTTSLGTVSVSATITTYTVTVATGTNSYGTGNKFYINGSVSPTLTLTEGQTYKFDQSDSSNSTHPLRFSTTANGTHAGGSEYTTGVTTNGTPGSSGAYTQITVASGAPTLYYYCTNHSGMGGTANTP